MAVFEGQLFDDFLVHYEVSFANWGKYLWITDELTPHCQMIHTENISAVRFLNYSIADPTED